MTEESPTYGGGALTTRLKVIREVPPPPAVFWSKATSEYAYRSGPHTQFRQKSACLSLHIPHSWIALQLRQEIGSYREAAGSMLRSRNIGI